MEVVDNAIMLLIPGAMEAGVTNELFWGSLSVALVIAGAAAVPVNRRLIPRGKGHAVLHETGIHGGPSPRTVGIDRRVAGTFGTAVLLAEALDDQDFDRDRRLARARASTRSTWRSRSGCAPGSSSAVPANRLQGHQRPALVARVDRRRALRARDRRRRGGARARRNGVLEPLDALDSAGVRATGVAIFIVGLVGTLYAQVAMGESWRIGVDEDERTALVTTRPVRGRAQSDLRRDAAGFARACAARAERRRAGRASPRSGSRSRSRCGSSRSRTCFASTATPIGTTPRVWEGSCQASAGSHDLPPDHPRRPRVRVLPRRRRGRRRRGRGRPQARDRRVPAPRALPRRAHRAHPRDAQPRRPRLRPRAPGGRHRRDDPRPPRRLARLRPRAVRRRLGARARQRPRARASTRPATGPSTRRSR